MFLPVKKSHILWTFVLGVALGVLGGFLFYFGVPYTVEKQLQDKISVHNGSDSYPLWRRLDFLEFNAYLFNVTNPDEVSQGKKPVLNEIGPFCYRLHKQKDEIKVNETEDTIIYNEHRYFYPIMSTNLTNKSCIPHNTRLTTINAALVASVQVIGDMSPYFLETFSEALDNLFPGMTDAFVRTTAQQVLFEGLTLNCSSQDLTTSLICKALKVLAPPQIKLAPNRKDYLFSMLGWMNGTKFGPFKILRGLNNISDIGATLEWNGQTVMNIWSEPRCNQIKGTDGYILPPIREDASQINLFGVDICRSISLRYTSDDVSKGMKIRRFEVTKDILDNSKENECYCPVIRNPETSEVVGKRCFKSGVMSLAPCFNKAPVILSWPHFYLGSEDYINDVEGLHPQADIHKSEALIQVPIGAPIFGIKRAQMNIFLQRNDIITMFENITEVLLPMIWIEEGAYTPEPMLDQIRTSMDLLNLLYVIVQVIAYAGLVITILAIISFGYQKTTVKPYVMNK